jgi:hypothetical protein
MDKRCEAAKTIANLVYLMMNMDGFTVDDIIGAIDIISKVLVVKKVLNLRDNGRSVRWIARSVHKSEKYVSTLIKEGGEYMNHTDRVCNGEHKTTCCEKKCQDECKKVCKKTHK